MKPASSEANNRGTGLALIGTVVPAVLLAGLFVIIVVVVPSAKRTFDEYGLTLPWLTLNVIRVSNWVSEYWWATVPCLAVFGAGNYLLLRELGRRGSAIPVLWIVAVSVVLVALIAVTLVSLELPMMKLREGLAR